MPKSRLRVRDLSLQSGLSPDEVLLFLWNEGIDYVTGHSDLIRHDDLDRARRAVGLATRRELTSIAYWQNIFRLSPPEFAQLLEQKGFVASARKRTLPTGAVRKLMAEMRRRELGAIVEPTAPMMEEGRRAPPSLIWYQVGHTSPLQMLSYDDVVNIHNTLVEDFKKDQDPIDPPGVKNAAMLQSAAACTFCRASSVSTTSYFIRAKQCQTRPDFLIEIVERRQATGLLIIYATLNRCEIFVALVKGVEGVVEHLGRGFINAKGDLRLNPLTISGGSW